MEISGSIHCITDHNGRVGYILLTGKKGMYAVGRIKKSVGYYDRDLFEHMAYAIRNRFIDNDK
jgi:hypothetical protein